MARFEWPDTIEFAHASDEDIVRRRHGRGFVYATLNGRRVSTAATLARIAAIAIPPAWTQVRIAASEYAHLQATGRDARGRKQYRYHPTWQLRRSEANYGRLAEFGRALPAIRSFVDTALRRPQLDRERVLALALRLLDSGMIRVGNEEYAKTNGSRGLTTLGKRNVAIRGDDVRFHFVGKGGVEYDLSIHDARAARVLRRCHELPGQRLFRFVDETGALHPITSADVNHLLEELTGQKFTAKDFRTWTGTVHTFAALAGRAPGASETATVQAVNEVARATAAVLGNTLAVCKRHYVHPGVIDAFVAGELAALRIDKRARSGLSPEERALARFLDALGAGSRAALKRAKRDGVAKGRRRRDRVLPLPARRVAKGVDRPRRELERA